MKKLLILAFLTAPLALMAQDGFMRTPKGVQYKIVNKNTGDRIKLDDVITFNVVQKTDKDSVLFSSYTLGHPIKIQVKASENIGDMMDVFPLLTAKDSAIVKVPTDSIFVGHEEARPPFFPKGSNLVFTVKIDKVQSLNDAIAERNAAMEKMRTDEAAAANKYIADHGLTSLTATTSGLKYVITQPGVGPKIVVGDTVLVNYAGRNTENKVFDTSIEEVAKSSGLNQPGRAYEPLKLIVGVDPPVIKGWDEGLVLLNKGAKATLVIPSSLGYGDQGAGNDIKPFSTIIFDMEIVKVMHPKPKPAKAGAKAPVKKPGTTTAPNKTPAKANTPVKKPVAAPVKK
ncbi:MAG: FKBP-type peptidyl-prolyl cis-trans isomerase [Bacteroidota bacterium]